MQSGFCPVFWISQWYTLLLAHTHTGTLHTQGEQWWCLPSFPQLPQHTHSHSHPLSSHTLRAIMAVVLTVLALLWDTTALFSPGLRNLSFPSAEGPRWRQCLRTVWKPGHSGLWGQLYGIPVSSQHACSFRDGVLQSG